MFSCNVVVFTCSINKATWLRIAAQSAAGFSSTGFLLTLTGEQSGLVQFVEKVGFLPSIAGCAVNILSPVRRVTPTGTKLHSNFIQAC